MNRRACAHFFLRAPRAVLASIALAACAAIAAGTTEEAKLLQARVLIDQASQSSLRQAAALLGEISGEASAPGARDLSGLGREMHRLLYPETPNPYPDSPAYEGRYAAILATARSGEISEGSSADPATFLDIVLPLIGLASGGAKAPGSRPADMQASLMRSAMLHRTSVLPSTLLAGLYGRLGAADAATLAEMRAGFDGKAWAYPMASAAAEILLAKGNAACAIPLLEGLAVAVPDDLEVLKTLAGAALAAGLVDKALVAAARAVLLDPEDSEAVILRVKALEASGNPYQALRVLDAMLKAVAGTGATDLLWARLVYEVEGNASKPVAALEAAERSHPDDPELPELRGRILLESRRFAESRAALGRALSIEPARLASLTLLAKADIGLGDWQGARNTLASVPREARDIEWLAMSYQAAAQLGDAAGALVHARAIAAARADDASRILLARALIAAGEASEAARAIEEWLPSAGTSESKSALHALRASALSPTDPEEALRDLRWSIFENPDNPEALLLMSAALEKQGEFRKALAYMKRAAELLPADKSLREKTLELENLPPQ